MLDLILAARDVINDFGFDVFMGLTFVDVVTGYGKAIIGKKYNSSIDTSGWVKRIIMVLVLIMLYPLTSLGDFGELDNVYSLFLLGFNITAAGSVLENLVALGVPIPDAISKYIADEKKKL